MDFVDSYNPYSARSVWIASSETQGLRVDFKSGRESPCGHFLLPFVEHFYLKKKGISFPSFGRPVPPIRHSGLKNTWKNELDMFLL